ncbi:PcfB family protein [Streptococcus alactolyticus]|uniref:PcfB family protein n=1 Tax=Streptococcus alactolyticus TaxID=29389 RepID=UPI003F9B7A2D
MMQEDVNNKTVTFCIRTTKMSMQVLQKAVKIYLDQTKQVKNKVHQKMNKKENQYKSGKVTVKELAAQNAGMTNIDITSKNIKSFERYARKYGVQYALKKDNTRKPPVYMVFFKGRDQDAITAAFREFQGAQLKKANSVSIHQRLSKYMGMIKSQNRQKVKQKHQEQSR